ncbi:MAG: signal peptidase [Solirubrobacterales bacterium]|jgi:signal peptidase|nr:signal peptidase [Solirubrobacterales bacterium]
MDITVQPAAAEAGGRTTRSFGPRLRSALGTAALGLTVALAGLMLIPGLFGLQRYVITGGSMTGTYDRGSIVFSEVVSIDRLRVGDVITYQPPSDSGVEGLVTHRIVSIRSGADGEQVLRTKGDANQARDPWRFTLSGGNQARVVAGVPYLGYAFAVLGVRLLRMVLIGGPALFAAAAILIGLWRRAGEEMLREREAAAAEGAG